MKFYAIAYKFEEDVWYDLEKEDDVYDLNSTCLLPTKELAEQIISEGLSVSYEPVEIELETLNKNGTWSWSREFVPSWE